MINCILNMHGLVIILVSQENFYELEIIFRFILLLVSRENNVKEKYINCNCTLKYYFLYMKFIFLFILLISKSLLELCFTHNLLRKINKVQI